MNEKEGVMKILEEKVVGDEVLWEVELSDEEYKILVDYAEANLSQNDSKLMNEEEKINFSINDILKKQAKKEVLDV